MSTLIIVSKSHGHIELQLPLRRHYEALSAGDWAHDVASDIALIRFGENGTAIIDVYTLLLS